MTTGRLSYLDRKIKLALDFTEDRKMSSDLSADIFGDAQIMLDDARERRGFSEKAFLERSKLLLVVLGRLKFSLVGQAQKDVEALMDTLLTEVTRKV